MLWLGYLGSSSSWSFSWQIRCFLKNAVGNDVPINLVPNSEEETYTMGSASIRDSPPLVDDEIPSREYAEYLANTTLFHLGATYHVFEKKSFMVKLNQFYDEGFWEKPLKDLWHMQLLLVIAFGKLFLRRGASSLGPPGATDFLRALRLQPDVLNLWDDPILRMETLCLISLYLLTADIRGTSYAFVCTMSPFAQFPTFRSNFSQIGQAMRIALSLGMNRETPTSYLDKIEYERRRRVWWTVYIIDRKLSINMGAPLSISDQDFDISLPGKRDLGFSNSALNLHIKLAVLEGKVMSGTIVYSMRFLIGPLTSLKLRIGLMEHSTKVSLLESRQCFRL